MKKSNIEKINEKEKKRLLKEENKKKKEELKREKKLLKEQETEKKKQEKLKRKEEKEYEGISHIYSWFGSLFTYQLSQAFYNFKLFNDENGINYYENSVNASKTNFLYCKNLEKSYKTFSTPSWGLTACDIPKGYSGELGTLPRGFKGDSYDYLIIRGTVAPTAAISSMPFIPDKSYEALIYYQSNRYICDEKYGLRDSFNLDYLGEEWYDNDFIGIDKGIEVLQLYNYIKTDFISNLSINNPFVIEGFINNDFVRGKN